LDVPVRQIVEQVNPGYYNSATAQRWGEKPPIAVATATTPAASGLAKTDSTKPDSTKLPKPINPTAAAIMAATSGQLAANTAATR
jgi:hypothetical protein